MNTRNTLYYPIRSLLLCLSIATPQSLNAISWNWADTLYAAGQCLNVPIRSKQSSSTRNLFAHAPKVSPKTLKYLRQYWRERNIPESIISSTQVKYAAWEKEACTYHSTMVLCPVYAHVLGCPHLGEKIPDAQPGVSDEFEECRKNGCSAISPDTKKIIAAITLHELGHIASKDTTCWQEKAFQSVPSPILYALLRTQFPTNSFDKTFAQGAASNIAALVMHRFGWRYWCEYQADGYLLKYGTDEDLTLLKQWLIKVEKINLGCNTTERLKLIFDYHPAVHKRVTRIDCELAHRQRNAKPKATKKDKI